MATLKTLLDENGYPISVITGAPDQEIVTYRIKCNSCGELPEDHEPETFRCDLRAKQIWSEMCTVFNY